MTKTQLAEAIDVDRRAINAYEAGEYPPSDGTMSRIQSVLHFPEKFFEGEDLEEPSMDTGSFRSMSKMTASQRDMALSQAALGLHLCSWIEKRFALPEPEIPDLGYAADTPEVAADLVRQSWGLGQLSIRNMIHLLESKGVRVFSLTVEAKEVDAFSMWKGGIPFVFLNTFKTAEHSRFDAAHELAHLALHKHGSPQGRTAEAQANQFASAFLMPRGSVLASRIKFPTFDSLVKAKRQWGVSLSALAYRLHQLRILSDWHYRSIVIEVSKRGKSTEPEPMASEASILLSSVFAALSKESIGRTRIAEELAIPVAEIEQLLHGLAITSVDGGRKNRGLEGERTKLQLAR